MFARRRPVAATLVAALLGLGAGTALAAASRAGRAPGLDNPALRSTQPYMQGEILVKFAERLPLDGAAKASGRPAIDALLQRHAVTDIRRIANGPKASAPAKRRDADLSRVYVLTYADGSDAMEFARELAAEPGIEYAEPRFVYQLALVPNDPSYGVQAGYYNKMQFPTGWDITRGSMGSVVVAIADGGTDWDHQDLIANVWTNPGEIPGNGIDDDNNGFVDDVRGWNFANNTNDPTGLPATPTSAHHGSHVAGIVAATANNAIGIAGASYNAKYMPICAGCPTADGAICYGYDAVIYAAENGAAAVNCSWGGQGSPSAFEQNVIAFAHQQGTVVVAAAGNNGDGTHEFFPAAYDHVLAVANVHNSDQRNLSTNYGLWVDVSAQGTSIYSTMNGGTAYGYASGTSMSSPHVAAACALVKTRWPGYTPEQVMQRVRVTSDNIDGANPAAYQGKLGYGRINAAKALTKNTPAVAMTSLAYTTSDGDAILEPGETVRLDLTVTNYLAAATTLGFKLRDNSTYITPVDSAATLVALDSLQSAVLPALTFAVSPSTPIQHTVLFTLHITTGAPAYTDNSRFELTVLPMFATHDANLVDCSVTSVGKLGFALAAGGTGKDGIGWIYNNRGNLLFEGALLLGTSAARVSDGARTTGSTQDDDFLTVTNGIPIVTEPFGPFAEYGVATFTDALAEAPLGIRVRQESYERLAPYDDFIILRYTIRNTGASTLSNLRAGWYCDWDIDASTYRTNRTGYDAARGLIYAYDSGGGPTEYVGTKVLTPPGTTSARGIYNDPTHPSNPSWGVYDSYSNQEKWETLSAGIVFTNAGPEDVATGIGTGPFTIAAGDSVEVAFAFIGGDNLADLQANADLAQALWDDFPTTADAGGAAAPRFLRMAQNAPNPFNPTTAIAFDMPREARVRLQIYRADGRLVRTLVDEKRSQGAHRVTWDGKDDAGRLQASGTYFYRFAVEGGATITRKMQLVR